VNNNAFDARTQPIDWLELSENHLPVAATSNSGGDQVI
jgi:hypothetical protein